VVDGEVAAVSEVVVDVEGDVDWMEPDALVPAPDWVVEVVADGDVVVAGAVIVVDDDVDGLGCCGSVVLVCAMAFVPSTQPIAAASEILRSLMGPPGIDVAISAPRELGDGTRAPVSIRL
jgi:hypothetical protein